MKTPHYVLVLVAVVVFGFNTSSLNAAANPCKSVYSKLGAYGISVPLDLKKAQELAEDFVNRNIASEVLTDPGVEMALSEKRGVREAIEEALLARGMSPGQAKKASTGWVLEMKKVKLVED